MQAPTGSSSVPAAPVATPPGISSSNNTSDVDPRSREGLRSRDRDTR
jgi:hypothetical protein